MNTIKYIFILATITLLSSCESILNETVYNFKTSSNAFLTESDAVTHVTSAYVDLNSYRLYSQGYWRVLETASGCITRRKNTNGNDDNTLIQKTYLSTNNLIDDVWTGHYIGINTCNVILKGFATMNINADVKNSVTGEALFLRSMHYFNLVRMWGAVPLRLDPTSGVSNAYSTRASEADVYAQITSDLKLAATLMPVNQTLKGRATKGAAYALLAKVYLTMASMKKHSGNVFHRFDFVTNADAYYDSTRIYCKKVVALNTYTLPNNFISQFAVETKNSSESIFEVQFTTGIWNAGSFLPNFTCPYIYGNSFDLGYESHRFTKKSYNDFNNAHPNDYRLESSIFGGYTGKILRYNTDKVTPMSTGTSKDTLYVWPNPKAATGQYWPYLYKYRDPKATAYNQHGTNFIYLRFADVLLMYAEAENELNGPGNAYQYVNQLMARARKANGVVRTTPEDWSNMDQNTFRMAIWKERRFELMGEAHLWYDLVRTGQYENYLNEYKTSDYDASPTSETEMTVNVRNLLFPIPHSELNRNNLMTQNPDHI